MMLRSGTTTLKLQNPGEPFVKAFQALQSDFGTVLISSVIGNAVVVGSDLF